LGVETSTRRFLGRGVETGLNRFRGVRAAGIALRLIRRHRIGVDGPIDTLWFITIAWNIHDAPPDDSCCG